MLKRDRMRQIMAKNNWKKYQGIIKEIKKIVKKGNPTTNQVATALQERGLEITWKTAKKYLLKLESEGEIKSAKVAGNITMWNRIDKIKK